MITIALLLIGFVILIKGADLLVDGASFLAYRLKINKMVIGLTIVALGTSLPELFVNIFASVNDNPEIAIGNILGSNTANILLILGLSAAIYPLHVSKGTVWKEIPFCFLATLLLGFMMNDRIIDNDSASFLSRIDGLVLLSFFIIFLYYVFSIAGTPDSLGDGVQIKEIGIFKAIVFIILGLTGLASGGKWIVDGAVWLAKNLKMSESAIGLTIVAFGTSLPELATSIVAVCKKNVEIAVGNVIGSNIFNIFLILGISSLIKPLPLAEGNNSDILVVIIATLLLFISMFTGKKAKIDRWEGIVFVTGYVLYITYLFVFRR
ncbi:MAG: calcium/sodium antiporter [Spirochaetales bacterium]|nr:calcium/sodium antiporter [Spirochaetales bacterium]